ncbi:MAG: DIP1984 family protein [Clostridia bacterium]|nr:DIP1984 family protein [Clostridia bacterium]
MKLAEALIERSDLQTRIDAMRERLMNNARVQEGEIPAEDPIALMRELDAMSARVEELIRRINLTTSATAVGDTTVTGLIAHRDCLAKRVNILRNFLSAASSLTQRASRTEIVVKSTVSVPDLQKQIDALSKELRETDTAIQAANWTTELI